MHYYKSKKVLITGASSGIGVSFARLLASYGAEIILTARRKDRLDQLAGKLADEFNVAVEVIPCDLSDPSGPRQLFDELVRQNLEVDILINNAGFGYNGKFEKADTETYEQMIPVNVTAPVILTRLLLPGMIARNRGGVLNVASMAGFLPIPYFSVYSATKQFVINFSWSLWHELKQTGIHVTVLCPGPVDTAFIDVAEVDRNRAAFRGLQKPGIVAEKGLRGLSRNRPMSLSRASLWVPYLLARWLPVKIGLLGGEAAMKK